MGSNTDVTIIGGGVIGLACAHYLAEAGARVRVIDRSKIGQGASHANCGLLYFSDLIPLCAPGAVSLELIRTLKGISPLFIKPDLDFEKYGWLIKFAMKCRPSYMSLAGKHKHELLMYSMGLFKPLLASSPLPCDFEDKGLLTVFRDEKKFNAHAQTQTFLTQFGLQAERLDADRLRQLEPALLDDLAGGWYNRSDWHLKPDLLMTAWHGLLKEKGVDFIEDCTVERVLIKGHGVDQIDTDHGPFTSDQFVLAAGAWSPQITKPINLNLPVIPGKGYSLTMQRPEICPTYPCLLYERNMVVTHWKSAYRLGGTMEFSGYSDSLNRKRIDKLIEGAKAYLKTPVGEPLIEEWTSLRPMIYDDMPVIDRAGRMENLVIATGHGMLGLTLATGTGKIVSDLVLDRPPEIDITPYALSRFN